MFCDIQYSMVMSWGAEVIIYSPLNQRVVSPNPAGEILLLPSDYHLPHPYGREPS